MTQMNSSSSEYRGGRLPWPDGFGSSRPRGAFVAGVLIFALAVPFFIGTCLSGISEQRWPSAILGAAGAFGALVFAVLCGHFLRKRRSGLPRGIHVDGADGMAAITVPTTKVTVAALYCFSAAAVAVGAARLLVLAADGLGTNAARSLLTALIMAALIAGGVWLAAIGLSVSRKPKTLRLSPAGVDFRNGFVHQHLPWNSVAAIQPTTTNANPSIQVVPSDPSALLVGQTSRVRQRTNLDRILIPPTSYGIDPALLYYTLDFYARHPNSRSELGSDAAIERMRRGDVLG